MFDYKITRFLETETFDFKGAEYLGLFNTITEGELMIPKTQWMDIQRSPADHRDSPLMDHLIENSIFIGKSIDENRLLHKHLMDNVYYSETLKFKILVNRTCNLNCAYCFEKTKTGVMDSETALATYRFIRNYIQKKKPERVFIDISGGEPFLNLGIIGELASKLKDFCSDPGIHFELHLTTNGTLMTRESLERLISLGLTILRVSMAGPEKIHDALRVDRQNRGTYARITDNLRHIPESVRLLIECQYPPGSDDYLIYPEMMDDLAEKDIRVDSYGFSPIIPGREESPCHIAMEDPEKARYLKRVGVERGYPMYETPPRCGCAADLEYYFTIDYNGAIVPCPCLKVGELAFGNTRTDIDYVERSQRCRELPDKCLKECGLTPSCNGFCRLFPMLETGRFNGVYCPEAFLRPMIKDHIQYKSLAWLEQHG